MLQKKGAFSSDGYNAYSYQTCIMTRGADGKLILNITRYSATTTRHQNMAFGGWVKRERNGSFVAISGNVHTVDDVPRMATADDLRRLAEVR